MTAKEALRARVDELSEAQAASAHIVVEQSTDEADTVGSPVGSGRTATGEPMPDVVAAVRRLRDDR
jgi:hypothetical protein